MAYIPVDHTPKPCLWCNTIFKPNTKHQRFCKKACYRKFGKMYLGHSEGKHCKKKYKKPADGKLYSYRKYKKSACEFCGFIPEHPCQLDVDHIDGNHSNNDVENLQTLCANCHRLKTAYQLGWIQ